MASSEAAGWSEGGTGSRSRSVSVTSEEDKLGGAADSTWSVQACWDFVDGESGIVDFSYAFFRVGPPDPAAVGEGEEEEEETNNGRLRGRLNKDSAAAAAAAAADDDAGSTEPRKSGRSFGRRKTLRLRSLLADAANVVIMSTVGGGGGGGGGVVVGGGAAAAGSGIQVVAASGVLTPDVDEVETRLTPWKSVGAAARNVVLGRNELPAGALGTGDKFRVRVRAHNAVRRCRLTSG